MSIIPLSRLSDADLSRLGNNLVPTPQGCVPLHCRRRHRQLAAVNRSLAPHGERVARLYATAPSPPPVPRQYQPAGDPPRG